MKVSIMLLAIIGLGCHHEAPVFFGGDPLVVADSSGYAMPGTVEAGDLDGDGDLDIAAVGPANLLWFENTPEGFTRHDITDEGCANALLILDMDDDGRPDLVTAAGGPPDGRSMPGLLYWWKNPAWSRMTLDDQPGNFLHDLLAVDLDNDGKEEIVAPRGAAYQGRDEAYDGLIVYEGGTWDRVPLRSEEGNVKPSDFGLASGDIDGDGFTDLVQFQTVWLNPGAIRKPWKARVWTEHHHPSNLCVRDMNGDGRQDIVFTEGHSHRAGNSRVGVWWNGDAPRIEVLGRVARDPENLAVADLDRDGAPDVITGAMNWRPPSSWNAMNGTLVLFSMKKRTRHEMRAGLSALHHLSLVDMDGDGDLDLLAENPGAAPEPVVPSVQILWNYTSDLR